MSLIRPNVLRPSASRGALLYRFAAALCLVLVAGARSHAFEYAAVPGVPAVEKPGRRADFLFGFGIGMDTNVTRGASGSAKDDIFYELITGLEFVGNYPRGRYALGAEASYEAYGSLDGYDFLEYNVKGELLWRTRKARLGVAALWASLNDPVDVETAKIDVLGRRVTSYVPGLGFTLGKLELEGSYGFEALEFVDDTYVYLDHRDTGFEGDLRFWIRPQVSQFFVHYDSGRIDYVLPYNLTPPDYTKETDQKDFGYTAVHGGVRAGSPGKAHYEIGVGRYTVSGEGVSEAAGPVFSFRSTIHGSDSNSKFEMTYSMGPEAAATAEYKTAQRIQVEYVRQTNARLRWSFAYRTEISAFQEPDAGAPGSLTIHLLHVGLERDVGSGRGSRGSRGRGRAGPMKWHGRLYCALDGEFGDDFERFRASVGMGLVH